MSRQQGIQLHWYLLATAAITMLLFGVDGIFLWAMSAVAAWLLTRNTAKTPRDYLKPAIVFLLLTALQFYGRMLTAA
jgi:hypothetical protein